MSQWYTHDTSMKIRRPVSGIISTTQGIAASTRSPVRPKHRVLTVTPSCRLRLSRAMDIILRRLRQIRVSVHAQSQSFIIADIEGWNRATAVKSRLGCDCRYSLIPRLPLPRSFPTKNAFACCSPVQFSSVQYTIAALLRFSSVYFCCSATLPEQKNVFFSQALRG